METGPDHLLPIPPCSYPAQLISPGSPAHLASLGAGPVAEIKSLRFATAVPDGDTAIDSPEGRH